MFVFHIFPGGPASHSGFTVLPWVAGEVEHVFTCLSASGYILSSEMFVHVLPFANWIVLNVEFWEFLGHRGLESFSGSVVGRCLHLVLSVLSFS